MSCFAFRVAKLAACLPCCSVHRLATEAKSFCHDTGGFAMSPALPWPGPWVLAVQLQPVDLTKVLS